MKNSSKILFAFAVALLGCSDPTASPPAHGALSFNFVGAGFTDIQLYNAEGQIPFLSGSTLGNSEWAAASFDQNTDLTVIAASIPTTSVGIASAWDFTSIAITRKTVGTVPIDPDCTGDKSNCTGVVILFNYHPQGAPPYSYRCFLTSGSVTIGAVTVQTVAGLFSGTGTCSDAAGVLTPFSITDGTFSTGISSQL